MKSLVKGLIFGSLVTGLFEGMGYLIPTLKENFWDNPKLIYGYHVHHSVLGLLLIIIGFIGIFSPKKSKKFLFLIGVGLGIIIIHTITGGFVFIEYLK